MSINQVVKVAMDNAYEMGKRDGRNEADATIRLWEDCGNKIMQHLFGKQAPLSDSDVIAQYERLRQKNVLLRNEVRAWREAITSISYDEWRDAVEAAIAATNAANALDDK